MKNFLQLAAIFLLCAISVLAQNPPGSYSYPSNQSSSGSATPTVGSQISFGATVSPLAYGGKWDAKYSTLGVYSIGVANVTCSECAFTSADVGKIVFGYESPFSANNGLGSYATLLAQTTILSVTNATTIVANATASNSCNAPGSAVCLLVYGSQDDSTAINNAATAAWETGGLCKAIEFPSGYALFGGNLLNIPGASLSSACGGGSSSGIDITQTGPEVFGQGPGNTWLIPLPGYNYAGCTTGQSTHGCNFTTPNLEAHDFGVNGAGQSTATGNPTVSLFEIDGSGLGGGCTGATAFNITAANWLVNDANAIGFDFGRDACGDPTAFNIVSELFGNVNCDLTNAGTVLNATGLACFGNYAANGVSLQINLTNGTAQANSVTSTTGGYYGNCSSAAVQISGASGRYDSRGDFIATITANAACTPVKANGGSGAFFGYFDGDAIAVSSTQTGGQAVWNEGPAGTQIHIKNSQITGAGTSTSVFQETVAGDMVFDDGGNQITQGTVKSSFTAGGFIADGHAAKGICTGTATAASTIGLRISGSSTTGTAVVAACTNSAVVDSGIPVQGQRTVNILVVSAGTGGTNASSGVVTVLKNGGATTMTCTLGTGTTCVDDQHPFSVNDGDLISIQFTTQAADTLANVKAVASWN